MNIALISDAGTPAISDPGMELAAMCIEEGIEVTSLPGASACITALTVSGLSTRRFCFEGFLPSEKEDKKERRAVLDRLAQEIRTTVFYEAPHRLLKTLGALSEAAGPGRKIAVCRELTKRHESFFRGSIEEAISYFEENPPRGEIVIVLDGADEGALELEKQRAWEEMSIQEHMQLYLDEGLDKKAAMKKVAADRGISKREVYSLLVRN